MRTLRKYWNIVINSMPHLKKLLGTRRKLSMPTVVDKNTRKYEDNIGKSRTFDLFVNCPSNVWTSINSNLSIKEGKTYIVP